MGDFLSLFDAASNVNSSQLICDLPDPVIAINEKGMILHCNRATQKKFGYTEMELTGKNVNLLMPQPEAESHDEYIQKYLVSGVRKVIGTGRHVYGKHKDGTLIPFYLSVSEQKTESGSVFVGFLADLSDSVAANLKLEAVLKAAPLIIMYVGPDLKIRFINHTTSDLKPEDAIGNSVLSFLDGENQKVLAEAFEKAKRTKSPVTYLNHYVSKLGATLVFESHLNPVFNNGILDGAVIVAKDITEKIKIQNELKTLLAQKENLLREVFHRVKNNFQVMDSLLALQTSAEKSEASKTLIQQIRNRIYAQAAIHNMICMNPHIEKLDLESYLDKMAEHLRMTSGGYKILPLSKCSGVHVTPDQAMAIGSIFNELISNSLKYGVPNGSETEIYFAVGKVGSKIQFRYSDSGPYYQGVQVKSDLGLGTRIIRSFVENIGAEFDLVSEKTPISKYCHILQLGEKQ